MSLTITSSWNWVGNEYKVQYAETSDPRILAVIERQDWDNPIDGDCYAPAFWWDRERGELGGAAGATFMDSDSEYIAERIIEARGRFYDQRSPWAVVERYARIFHGTSIEQVSSHVSRDSQVVIFGTPTWRDAVGNPDATKSGDRESWQSALDGDVYGVGYAVQEGRVDTELPVDFDAFEVTIECWGFVGEKYAIESAAAFEYGEPELPTLLAI